MKWDNGTHVWAQFWSEVNHAADKWGSIRSTHETYGVLAEEMMELLQAIHANDLDQARAEALQIAAVAYRFARDGIDRNPKTE